MRLTFAMACISQGLRFDVRRGSQAIGAAVRDAACYVLWTLARSFGRTDLLPFADELRSRLVSASLFDREVQIRRAASAAFQEIVGRHVSKNAAAAAREMCWHTSFLKPRSSLVGFLQDLFPNGIMVLQEMNFFTVGLRRKSFLHVAVSLAQ